MDRRPLARRPAAHAPRSRGFTLVEVLVALLIMAVMAAMGWQGIDGMVRARDASQAASERTLRLSTVLAQWEQDLLALVDSGGVVPALGCDGATLRLTRRVEGGVQLVAWSLREGRWLRWASPVATRAADLQQGWLRSQQLIDGGDGQLRMLEGATGWQLYFYRGSAWSNCQSSDDIEPAVATPADPPEAVAPGTSAPTRTRQRVILPTGVRLVLELDERRLTRDIVLQPQSP